MTYTRLLFLLRARRRLPIGEIHASLAAAGKSPADLLADLFGDDARPSSGAPCPRCAGTLKVLNTRRVGSARIRYIGCGQCGFRPMHKREAHAQEGCIRLHVSRNARFD